jgi:hypothetical protein
LEFEMKKFLMILTSASILASSGAFAQGLTRAEVHQELLVAEQNGSQDVTNASYPDVSPVYQDQVLHHKQSNTNAYGGMPTNSGASGARITISPTSHDTCVGPNSFCNIYAGS